MIVKLRRLIKITKQSRFQDSRIQRRLMVYWLSMILVILGVLLLIFAITGTFSASEKKLAKELSMSQNTFMSALDRQMNYLESSAIALSENASIIIDETLGIQSVSTLNNDLDGLKDLETSLFPLVTNALDSSQCSGAFAILNATANTSAPDAENSRAGIYVRYANLSTTKSARQDKSLFRGIAAIVQWKCITAGIWNLTYHFFRDMASLSVTHPEGLQTTVCGPAKPLLPAHGRTLSFLPYLL